MLTASASKECLDETGHKLLAKLMTEEEASDEILTFKGGFCTCAVSTKNSYANLYCLNADYVMYNAFKIIVWRKKNSPIDCTYIIK